MSKKKITENADYDYGSDNSTQLRTYKIRPHDFKSKPQGKVKYTGNYADNAMYDDSKINESDDFGILDRLHDILTKASVSDDEIVDGIQLTDRGKQKVAAALGIAGSEVELMINSLSAKMRGERELQESNDRYSAEDDYLDNVTVRDSKTGKEKFIRGSRGAHLKKQLANSDEQTDQQLMKNIIDEDDNDWISKVRDKHEKDRQTYLKSREQEPSGFMGTMKKIFGKKQKLEKIPTKTSPSMGTFNFHWSHGGKTGTGTAQFHSRGQRISVEVTSIRDRFGREYEPDRETALAIQRDAYNTVGGATY